MIERMEKYKFSILLLITIIFIVGCGNSEDKTLYESIQGKVISVIDGDTIVVLDNKKIEHKVRLYCIDAPEKDQDFGNESKGILSSMILEKNVIVKYREKDICDRIIGMVYIESLLINLEQVKKGAAWVYREYCSDCEFYDAEKSARDSMKGLWALPDPIPPWEYRKDPEYSSSI